MNIIESIHNQKLFRPIFRDLDTWAAWLTLLRVFFGLELDSADLDLYQQCTGREKPPEAEFKELWCVCGRRGGKSFIASIVACYLALFFDYSKYLAPGELGVIMIISADKAQSQTILNYCKGILRSNRVFEQYIIDELKESLTLSNRIKIEVHTCNFRSIRGRTVVTGIFDESAFWMHEGSRPDYELLAAIRPSMSTIPNSKLIVVSSPYSRQGILFEHFEKYYGKDDEQSILVWQSPTRIMNPTIPQDLIDRELEKDPSAGRSEWLAIWREDIESFLSREAIEACVVPGRHYLPPQQSTNYEAFVDASGGKHDCFTAAIAHNDRDKLVIDRLLAFKPPLDPHVVVKDITKTLRQYRIAKVTGDKYAAAWTETTFEANGIFYTTCALAKSDLYLDLEGKINMRKIELVDDELLFKELLNLERRTSRSGKIHIDHPAIRGAHDDRANSIAGICFELSKYSDLLFPELLRKAG